MPTAMCCRVYIVTLWRTKSTDYDWTILNRNGLAKMWIDRSIFSTISVTHRWLVLTIRYRTGSIAKWLIAPRVPHKYIYLLTCRQQQTTDNKIYWRHPELGTSSWCCESVEHHSSDTCMMLSQCRCQAQMASPTYGPDLFSLRKRK